MVVASCSQAWKTDALGDETWKDIMRHAVPFLIGTACKTGNGSREKNFSEADKLFCVLNLLGAQKTFHRQSVWIQIGVDGIFMDSHELIGDGSGNCQPREKLC